MYPLFLINDRSPQDPATVTAKPGQRLRLRIINAGADTAFRFAVGGHRLTVTHADGFPVTPVEVDSLLVGMAERYDVVVTAADGAFPIVAYAEGKGGSGLAVLRTASGPAPAATALPTQLRGKLLAYQDLVPTDDVCLPERAVTRSVTATLGFGKTGYRWTINGKALDDRVGSSRSRQANACGSPS